MATNEFEGRGLTQHGGPPGWLEDSDPAGCDFGRDGHIYCSRIGRSIVGIFKSFPEHINVEVGTVAGRTISFLGIYVYNFRYWFFAVWVSADKV